MVLGGAAIVLGARARRSLAAATQPTGLATAAIVLGAIAVVLPVVFMLLLALAK